MGCGLSETLPGAGLQGLKTEGWVWGPTSVGSVLPQGPPMAWVWAPPCRVLRGLSWCPGALTEAVAPCPGRCAEGRQAGGCQIVQAGCRLSWSARPGLGGAVPGSRPTRDLVWSSWLVAMGLLEVVSRRRAQGWGLGAGGGEEACIRPLGPAQSGCPGVSWCVWGGVPTPGNWRLSGEAEHSTGGQGWGAERRGASGLWVCPGWVPWGIPVCVGVPPLPRNWRPSADAEHRAGGLGAPSIDAGVEGATTRGASGLWVCPGWVPWGAPPTLRLTARHPPYPRNWRSRTGGR